MNGPCHKCQGTAGAWPCEQCQTLTCGKCSPLPTGDANEPELSTYCSTECRDGSLVIANFRRVECFLCKGTGRKFHRGRPTKSECYVCRGQGTQAPEPVPKAPAGPRRLADLFPPETDCPTCANSIYLGKSFCKTCDGEGKIPA